jgi:phospholipase D1/2
MYRHIDGHDYFWALSEILDSAKEVIFILDWWLTPEMYLRRPPAYYPEWRLDRLLLRKAQEGVKIFIVVYKEISATMTLDSAYTKVPYRLFPFLITTIESNINAFQHTLEALHYNIAVMVTRNRFREYQHC